VKKMVRKLKNVIKLLSRRAFEIGQKININILPCHWYSEVPNIWELRHADYWKKPYSMFGINGAEIENQVGFLKECCSEELIYRQRKGNIHKYACIANGEDGYGSIEADFLYCFIYTKRPTKIVQVGCGVSTAVMMLAAQEAGYLPEIFCIDPYPTSFLTKALSLGKIKLIQDKAQLVSLELLTNLGNNGLLFVDSSHTVKVGSELNRLILEVLPRLEKGSWVHFHDILFPYGYSRNILTTELFFSNESVLLHSFLINNFRYALRMAMSMLHYSSTVEIKKYLPNYCPAKNEYGLNLSGGHFPSSAYLEVV
jgi:hypothetical protein